MNQEATVKRMLEEKWILDHPAFHYMDPESIDHEALIEQQTAANREKSMRQPVKYKSKAQSQFEVQELAIAAEFNEVKDIQELPRLKREHKLKEFY